MNSLIERAVKYWSKHLRDRDFIPDNGDDSENGAFFQALSIVTRKSFREEDIKKFEEKLRERLERKYNLGVESIILRVDYEPESPELVEALKYAFGDEVAYSVTVFPCKTMMIIDFEKNLVTVKEGYASDFTEVDESGRLTNKGDNNA